MHYPYRNRLNARNLIVVKGTEDLIQQTTRVLRSFEFENLQRYTQPTSA